MTPAYDTIAALSTPTGESAIAAIRASGDLCLEIALKAFDLKNPPEPRRALRGAYKSLSGAVLDEVLFIYFKAPNSYTGEDMLEIFTHGNPFIVQTILEDLFARGMRLASHGEFTRRAFENMKLDLSQAEAVSLMISARSEKSLEAARKQLDGELSKRINSICDSLVTALAHIEAHIDFSEEDLPPDSYDEPLRELRKVEADTEKLISTSRYGAVLRDGLNVSIIGEPNAGKSSLLNALLGRDRAIVSSIAGTTRDFIVERTSIGGYCVNLTDTAGIRDSSDEIEAEGIRRSLNLAKNADLNLLVIDCQSPDYSAYELAKNYLGEGNTILVFNKTDIARAEVPEAFKNFKKAEVSALNQSGIEELKSLIVNFISSKGIRSSSDDVLVSARHSTLLSKALESTKSAIQKIDESAPSELVASDVRDALESVGDIVGRGEREEVLDKIFSTFCIGK